MKKLSKSKETALALSLGAIGVISRLPFLESRPFYTDSFHMLTGILSTGVAHPPGYIGYVQSARALSFIAGSPHKGILALNLISTFAAATALYFLARRWPKSTPLSSALAVLLFLVNPFAWYYGAVSLSFIAEAMTSAVAALFCWEVMRGRGWATWASSAALALGASVRQTLLVFLLPLWLAAHTAPLWTPWARGESIDRKEAAKVLPPLVAGLMLMAFLTALWMVPTYYFFEATGGYSEQFGRLMREAVWANSVFEKGLEGFIKNSAKVVFVLFWGMNATLVLYVFKPTRDYLKHIFKEEREAIVFIAIWILPGLVFYTLIFMGPPGYIFVFLPALYLPLAGVLNGKMARWAAIAVVAGALLFLLPGPLPPNKRLNRFLNVVALKYNARGIKAGNSRNLQNLDCNAAKDYTCGGRLNR